MHKIDVDQFKQLFIKLQGEGYDIVGPTIRDEAIAYDMLKHVEELPIGWTDDQAPGSYRLKRRKDNAYFGYNVGPHSWKKYLFPAKRKLWSATRSGEVIAFSEMKTKERNIAFLGVRSCEIEAIFIQDKVFIEGQHVDPHYKAIRDNAFIIAVHCTQAGPTCFCTSMNTGPQAKRGYDLSLTEIIEDDQHYFVVDIGSDRGQAILHKIEHSPCSAEDTDAMKRGIQHAKDQMAENLGMNTKDIKDILYRNLECSRWDEVAKRCLSCANCTLACPTCFCSDVEDITDLSGNHTERWKKWDSCFNVDHSYIHGGAIHQSTKSRYRQWLTHKLGSWIDQFGTSGCVGCGRCITWCPVGIDIREEMAAIRLIDESKENK